jgi:methylated-DNA-[protein]-cysteine S-methyltransferase
MNFRSGTVRFPLSTPLGPMTLAAHDTALVWAGFDGQKHEVDTHAWPLATHHPILRRASEQLQQYFAGERPVFDIPLDLESGTAFQHRVWKSLLAIACGSTTSYGSISAAIGNPKAVRAVGGAVGRNPISIIVPCHRVIGTSGALTGYAGGMERKMALLQLEGVRSVCLARAGHPVVARLV